MANHTEPEDRNYLLWSLIFTWVCVITAAAVIAFNSWGDTGTAATVPPQRPAAVSASPTAPVVQPLSQRANTPEDVLAKTAFVRRYKVDEKVIASGHSDKNLAAHGIGVCAMIANDDVTITDMVYRFMDEWHHHPGPVTPDAAQHVFGLALQEICPQLLPKWKVKRAL